MKNGRNLSNEKSCETSSPIKPPVEVCVDRSFKGPLVLSSATCRWLEVYKQKSLNGGKNNVGRHREDSSKSGARTGTLKKHDQGMMKTRYFWDTPNLPLT